MTPAVDWVASLSPWPVEGFGLDRMRELLRELGDPQRAFPAVHVVGTNGKSTATRTIEALLLGAGLSVGATVSPHVGDWSERITVDGSPADFARAIGRVRPPAEQLAATQFETITAAAFAEFAARGVDAAVVEAGLGGRLDATNVLDTRVVLLTNVGLEHTDVLGETPEEIAREKLAVAHEESLVVLPDNSFAHLVPGRHIVLGGARDAAEAFLGRPVGDIPEIHLPGRLEERRGELRDGAHNPDGVRWLAAHAPRDRYVVVASILADKNAEEMVRLLAGLGDVFVATESSNARALPSARLAEVARRHFRDVHAVADPVEALREGHALGEPVLVTGSLYLLADLEEAAR